MTCRDCIYYRIIGHTYGSCDAGDNRVVKFDEEHKCQTRLVEKVS